MLYIPGFHLFSPFQPASKDFKMYYCWDPSGGVVGGHGLMFVPSYPSQVSCMDVVM